MKALTEKQINSRLQKYYIKNYGELDSDEWYPNPSKNCWKFVRDDEVILLVCDEETGKVYEEQDR